MAEDLRKVTTWNGDNPYDKVKDTSDYGTFLDRNGETKHHPFVKLRFIDRKVFSNPEKKRVVCKVMAQLVFDIPPYWFNDLTANPIIEVTGTAKCSPEDEFDYNKGRLIAQAKAEQNAYTEAAKILMKIKTQLDNFSDALCYPLDKFGWCMAHNEEFINRVADGKVV